MFFTAAERRLLAGLIFVVGAGYGLEALRAAQLGPWHPATHMERPGHTAESGPAVFPSDSGSVVAAATGSAAWLPPEVLRETKTWPFSDGFLDINQADSLDLVALPGIGPSLAGRILSLRRARDEFASVDELLDVRGIGQKRLAELRRFVRVAAHCSLQVNSLRFSDCTPASGSSGSHVN